ncbi:acyltransferase family protein [Micromonospora siamensis]|uniref:Acyltransferase family protein n=1 Tax=Micromonospora siamensis TaxID=299152 RepID=A0A1C5GT64_9ACTN|nr:acyltransferase [Micromonospora siamensis]SCG36331.1 Acyltransferase family protein [Micromonospora siamensis]
MKMPWRLAAVAAVIDERTPAYRDRGMDGLRAVALLAVPTGHWLVGGFTLDTDGALRSASPLATFAALGPASWFLQLLAIFFLVGGYSSYHSHQRRTGSTPEWIRRRLARLGRPVLGVAAVWAVLLPVLHHGLGVPVSTLHTASTLAVQPLWFVGVYAVVTILTPYCVRASRRLGSWSAAPLLGSVAVVDLLRYGPYAEAMPSWLCLLNLLPGWMFAYQLGVAWADDRLGRRESLFLLAGGAALFATLLLAFHYPASMVGVPGASRTNSHPPSLLVLALAAVQSGAAILLRDRLARLLRRPAGWLPVAIVNRSAMTILCWHQTALLAAVIPAACLGGVGGLTTPPDEVGWLLARMAWMPLFAGLLVLIVRFARPLEAPWDHVGMARRAAAGVLAAGFGYFALVA